MSHLGKTQITFIFTAPPELVPEGDRLFASHAKWMGETHHREGDLALLAYNVVKGPQLSSPLDLTSEPTANSQFVLMEVYEKPEGLEDHWRQGQESWSDFGAFIDWAQKVDVAVVHGSPVMHSLW